MVFIVTFSTKKHNVGTRMVEIVLGHTVQYDFEIDCYHEKLEI